MYCIAMEEIAQGTQPVVVPAGLGCEQDGEQPNRADAAQINVATGLVRLSFLVQGIYARVSERHQLTPVQAKLSAGRRRRRRGAWPGRGSAGVVRRRANLRTRRPAGA